MSSNNDYGNTLDCFEVKMKLTDTIYNEENKMEENIINYVFPQENENTFDDIIGTSSMYDDQNYYEDNFPNYVNIDSRKDELNQVNITKSANKNRRISYLNNINEYSVCKVKHEITSESEVPEQVTLKGDYDITYRYIADFSLYNNKMSRMIPLDSLPNYFESIYYSSENVFIGNLETTDNSITMTDESVNNHELINRQEQTNEELTLMGVLIPYEYILEFEKEKSTILKDNYRKLQRFRQKGGNYKPRKVKEMSKSILRQENLRTFPITCRVSSWTIELGNNLYDTPYIWVNSIPIKGGPKVCYRLCWPANKYSKFFHSAKLKFEIVSRLMKTLLSPNSNRIGYKTFVDQIIGKVPDKSPKSTLKQSTEEISVEPNVELNSPNKRSNKEISGEEIQTTVWGESMSIPGSSEKDILLIFPFIEFYLQTYSKKFNLSKVLGLQIITSMKNKLIKMILNEDSSLNEDYISSNLSNLLLNNELMERIFISSKLQNSTNNTSNNVKKRRNSSNKNEDALKFLLPKLKPLTENFDVCLKILKISDFCHVFGEFLDLPINSGSLLSIQSFYSKDSLEKNKCMSTDIITYIYNEFKKKIDLHRSEWNLDHLTQQNLSEVSKILNFFPRSLLFSLLKSLTKFITNKLFEKGNNNEDSDIYDLKQNKKNSLFLKNEANDLNELINLRINFGLDLSFLNSMEISSMIVDEVTWPTILEIIQSKMNSNKDSFQDELDENLLEMDLINRNLKVQKEEEMVNGQFSTNSIRLEESLQSKNMNLFENESIFEILNWAVDTAGSGKIGKELLEQINNQFGQGNQKKKSNLVGRNDNLLGLDRFSNRYFLIDNTVTSNTLAKSIIIISNCMENVHNKNIQHLIPCHNPLCMFVKKINILGYSTPVSEPLETNKFESSCKLVTKKKEIETLINSLSEDHFCEFQLKLKLKGIFYGKTVEHQNFNSIKYAQDLIENNNIVLIPFNMNSLKIDMEKQFYYYSILFIIGEITAIYLKIACPIVICVRNELKIHFSAINQIFDLANLVFDQFIKGVDIYSSSKTTFKELLNLIKLICNYTMENLNFFGIIPDKIMKNNHERWIVELETIENSLFMNSCVSNQVLNKKLSIIALYLKLWLQKILPENLLSLSFGTNSNFNILPLDNGFIFDRDVFISRMKRWNEKYVNNISSLIPKQFEKLYYFKSGHLLVCLSWINCITAKNKQMNEYLLKLVEHFSDIPTHMADIEKLEVINICYNTGKLVELKDNQEESEINNLIMPFIILNCRVNPRKCFNSADDVVDLIEKLRNSFENIEQLNIEHFSRKRTSNRIRNNNLSNSYRDAIITDSTYSIADSRETFIKKNIKYEDKSQDQSRFVSLIVPLMLSNQTNNFQNNKLSILQKKSLEILNFRPTTPFYLVNEELFKISIRNLTEKTSFKVNYLIADKLNSGFIRRLIIDKYDVWDCIIVESDDSKKNKEKSLICLNLWQIVPN